MSSSEWDSFPVIAAAGAAAFVGVSLAYLAWSASRPASRGSMPMLVRSRGTGTSDVSSDVVKQIIHELDPIDSLYFDVSVAQHKARQVRYEGVNPEVDRRLEQEAIGWLGNMGALYELERSRRLGYVTNDEANKIMDQISAAVTDLKNDKAEDASVKLYNLQSWIAERFYRLVAQKFKEKGVDPPVNGDDPIVILNPKFEPMTEKKVEEWKAKGYSQGMIDKALAWARDWATGIAKGLVKDQKLAESLAESLYPRALDAAEDYIKAFSSQGG